MQEFIKEQNPDIIFIQEEEAITDNDKLKIIQDKNIRLDLNYTYCQTQRKSGTTLEKKTNSQQYEEEIARSVLSHINHIETWNPTTTT